MIDNTIIYEQPLNELVRACLRLEYVFHQIDHQLKDTSILGTRNIITRIIELLHLLERPDLKAKLAKELAHHAALLARLQNATEIDQKKLHRLLNQLEDLVQCLIDSNGKIGQNLREIELLNNLRLHLATPGGGCNFDIPIYHFWLQQPLGQRQATIQSWLEEFKNLRLAITLLLQLIRESTKHQKKLAEKGFYQELLDPQINLRLIRIAVPAGKVYPEVSISRHFVSIRFFEPNIYERSVQYPHDLSFLISYCIS